MIPTRTPDSNIVLYVTDRETGERKPGHDLPAERCVDLDQQHFYETTWTPDPGELKALHNGAPVLLRLWGAEHPPVSVVAGEPDPEKMVALLDKGHVERALGALYGHLRERVVAHIVETGSDTLGVAADDAIGTGEQFLDAWLHALEATRTPPGDGPTTHGQTGPNGTSPN